MLKYLLERHEYHKKLNPKFWTDFEFDTDIREKLIEIATDFYKSLELETPILDIILTGSLCNFNYNKYSDLDVHIVIDFDEVADNEKLVTDYFDVRSKFFNQRHDIYMRGHEVELYIQDEDEKTISTAIYSLLNDKWLIKPKHNEPEVDLELVDFKCKTIRFIIDELVKRSQLDLTPEEAEINYGYAKKFKKKISLLRKESLKKEGEFSVGNLIFKELRNDGYFGKLLDCITKLYDKIYSE